MTEAAIQRRYKEAMLWQVQITDFKKYPPAASANAPFPYKQTRHTIGVVASCMEMALMAVRDKYPNCRLENCSLGAPVQVIYEGPEVIDVINRLAEAAHE